MTATTEPGTTTTPRSVTGRDATVSRVFLAILQRDLYVTLRELPTFIAQVLLQPFFFVFVFGKVLAELGQTRAGYAQLLLPGIVALTSVLTGLQGTAFPLVIDFSFTKEIEDRLLAPLPLELVAAEKIVFGMIRSLIAASVMFPIGLLVLGHIPFDARRLPLLLLALVLGACTGSAMGLTIGTFVSVQKINIVFALVLTPLLFTGCSQYPWPSLGGSLEWFKIVTLLNPLTYVSELCRASTEPQINHIDAPVALGLLIVSAAVFTTAGIVGFRRRALS